MRTVHVVRIGLLAATVVGVAGAQPDKPFTLNGVRWTSQQSFIES